LNCEEEGLRRTADVLSYNSPVAQFLRSFVRARDEDWDNFLNRASSQTIGTHFSTPWTSKSTSLFVTLRLRGIINQQNDESLLALCGQYLSDLVKRLHKDRRPKLDKVQKDLAELSWKLLRKHSFRVVNFSLGEPYIAADDLRVLVEDVRIIEARSG